mmetsp:Transcript_17776/g.54358  ORF Transcript_17776/g.54358 Transcript_17776/m.54358 type:complete len:307 (-) Transcript_17776:507-1427(-)
MLLHGGRVPGPELSVHELLPHRDRRHGGAADHHQVAARPAGELQDLLRLSERHHAALRLPAQGVHDHRLDPRELRGLHAGGLAQPEHPLPRLHVPAVRLRLLARRCHGRLAGSRARQARARGAPRAAAEYVLRVPLLLDDGHDMRSHRGLRALHAALRVLAPLRPPARYHDPGHHRPGGGARRASGAREGAGRCHLQHREQSRRVAAHELRVHLQRAAGQQRGVEPVPRDRQGLYLAPAELVPHPGVHHALPGHRRLQGVHDPLVLALCLHHHHGHRRLLLLPAVRAHLRVERGFGNWRLRLRAGR